MAAHIWEDGDPDERASQRGDRQDPPDAQERRVLGSHLQQPASQSNSAHILAGRLFDRKFPPLFTQFSFGLLSVNSIIVSASVVMLSLILGGSAAYGFSRYPFPGSGFALGAILVTRMVTPASLVLPLYIMLERLHLSNTLSALIVGITVLNLPFAVWLLKPFFDALPREIEEAALLDGLSPIGVWWRIAVPNAGPGFKTVALFSFIAAWTDLLIPITMSTRPDGWTLTAGIIQMQTGFKIYWGR
jgi:ABC-type glycerol-3-phosphate transport system permease component